MKYYSRKCINYSQDRKITCGNEILLAGIQYYSRKWIITRGKKYYSRERIITRGNLFITRGDDILLAGEKYWLYMAPEGFRTKEKSTIDKNYSSTAWVSLIIVHTDVKDLIAAERKYHVTCCTIFQRNMAKHGVFVMMMIWGCLVWVKS